MKTIYLFLLLIFVCFGCSKLENKNENVKDPFAVSGESLFTNAQKKLADQIVNTNVNRNISRLIVQYWSETTYPQESQYDLTNRSIPDNHWDILYRDVLKDFDEAAKVLKATSLLSETQVVRNNKLAIIEILTVYTYSILVETFGNIPYSESLDVDKPTPQYDDGKTIYEDLVNRLTAAIATMDGTKAGFGDADNIYGGKTCGQWIKFANSLKLRMAMVLADADKAFAKKAAEEAASNVLASVTDNANYKYLNAQPNANQLYVDLVASNRNDFVIATTFTDTLNNLNDPRLKYFLTPTSFTFRKDDHNKKQDSIVTTGIGKVFIYNTVNGSDSSVYKTPPYAILASDSSKNVRVYQGGKIGKSNDFSLYSHIADAIQAPTFYGTVMSYSEVEFLLAEAKERGFNISGTAETHYNNAVTASILEWGGTSAEAGTYLANPSVAYTTAHGDFRGKIGVQKWISLYNRGLEAWTEFRKFDWPKLQAPSTAKSVFPLRYTYPIKEQTLNGVNYQAAAAAIGGDKVGTKLFWDKY